MNNEKDCKVTHLQSFEEIIFAKSDIILSVIFDLDDFRFLIKICKTFYRTYLKALKVGMS